MVRVSSTASLRQRVRTERQKLTEGESQSCCYKMLQRYQAPTLCSFFSLPRAFTALILNCLNPAVPPAAATGELNISHAVNRNAASVLLFNL